MRANGMAAHDAIERAIECNKGLDALVDLMMAADEVNAPKMDCLSELLYSVQRDLNDRLLDVQRCIDKKN